MAARPRVRVGIVGAGFVAHIHGEAYRHVRGMEVELACVTAARPERAQAFAREFGVARAVPDFHAVLADPEVDLVDLCVPAHLHAAMAIEAARAGKHVIVEKPLTGFFGPPDTPRAEMLTRALATADQVLAAAAAARVRLCYAENWVYAPPIQKARRLLAASGGPILRLVGEESHSGTHAPINKRWVTGGGGSLIGKACHPLGAALYLKADEGRRLRGVPVRPVSVMAETAQLADTATFRAASPRYLNIVDGADVEDWGTMLITFDDGTVAAISAADTVLGGIRNQMAIYGAKAVVLCNINPNDLVQAYAPEASVFGEEYIVEKIETKAGWTAPQPDEEWTTGYPQEIQDFVECAATGREPLSNGPLARDVTAVIYGAYLSATEGRRVDLRPYIGSGLRNTTFLWSSSIDARRECRISRPDPEADLGEVAPRAGVQQLGPRDRGHRVGGGGLARLREPGPERGLAPVERAGQPIGHLVGERRARHDEAPRAHRDQVRGLPRVRAGGHPHHLEERMLGLDAVDAVQIGHQEARARGPASHRREAGPAQPAAPQRGHGPVQHHPGPVARRLEEHGLEVAVPLEAQPVEHVAREDDETRPARPEGHRPALEIRDRLVGRIGAHHEHPGSRVHRGEDAQVGGRAADAGERLVRDLALHQREIERARLEQRHVLGAALGVAGPHLEGGIHLVDGGGYRLAIDRESAARGGGAEAHRRLLAHGGYATTARLVLTARRARLTIRSRLSARTLFDPGKEEKPWSTVG